MDPILLDCPKSRSVFISQVGERRSIDVSAWVRKPPGAEVTINPEELHISYSDIDSVKEVFVTATRNGLTAVCSFQVFVHGKKHVPHLTV